MPPICQWRRVEDLTIIRAIDEELAEQLIARAAEVAAELGLTVDERDKELVGQQGQDQVEPLSGPEQSVPNEEPALGEHDEQ
jgi:hypothetical protein